MGYLGVPCVSRKQEIREACNWQTITGTHMYQLHSVKDVLEDHYPQKTPMNQICKSCKKKKCYCFLNPSLQHSTNEIPKQIKTQKCFYFLVPSDSNCNVLLSSTPVHCLDRQDYFSL